MRPALVLLLSSFCAACACGTAGGESLTRITQVASDATCATGGVIIATGRDANSNGKLDDGEVKDQSEVCSGQSSPPGKTSLVQSTDVAAGDANCIQGGVKLDFGFDDGTGGGTAGNGKLEAGEILGTRYVCNGGVPYFPGAVTPPTNPAGSFRIETTGGAGTGAQGGAAGALSVRVRAGTLGGHTRVFKTGVTDAAFPVPSSGTFSAGSVVLPVTTDLTINAFNTVADGLNSGDGFFLVNNDDTLYRNQSGAATPATGIDISSGHTLTFALNFGNDAHVRVRSDIKSLGTLTTALLGDNLSRGNLVLVCGNFWGEGGSTLMLRGVNTAAGTGGTGGALTLVTTSKLVNAGNITTGGGDGDDGANGAQLILATLAGELYNTGNLDSRGGVGSVGVGGAGGPVRLQANYRGVRNSGSIDTTGGMGAPQGGNGGSIALTPVALGLVYNSGTLTSRGGMCADADCNGGAGGPVSLDANGGELRNSGPITTSGGDGKGQGNGGGGGLVHVFSIDQAANQANIALPAGELQLSGNIVTRGGAGNTGGTGGAVDVVLDASHLPKGQQLTLLGYSELIASGGASANAAGAAGGVVTVSNAPSTYQDSLSAPGGAALNFANVTAKGGDGNPGGAGGRFVLAAQLAINFGNANEYASNAGAVVVTGGAGANAEGGAGGVVVVVGPASAQNSGALTASGGAVTAGGNASGQGGTVDLESPYGAFTNSGVVVVNGGASTGDARGGGLAQLQARTVTNSANLTCNGGNATNNGGGGGAIRILSTGGASTSSGTLSAMAGTGANAGGRGSILIDGVDVTP